MFSKIGRLSLFGPLAGAGMAALILLIAGFFMIAGTVDTISRQREEAVIINGLAAKQQELEKSIAANLVWDEAVRYLDNSYSNIWATENVAVFFESTQGISKSFILDDNNNVLFASMEGKETEVGMFGAFERPVAAAVEYVRKEEKRRRATKKSGGTLGHPIQSSTTAIVEGMPHILIATLVQPDFGRAKIQGSHAPIVITAMEIDEDFLGGLARRYMLEGLHLENGESYLSGEAYVTLDNDRGEHVATVGWAPQMPGSMLLHKLAIPMFALIAAFVAVVAMLYRRSWKAAQNLIVSEARASHLAYHDHLTGLPNRTLFFDRLGIALDQARRSGKSVAIHCIDLDRFKEVNDTFGHQIGDELIKHAAARMAAICRRGDTVARLSGDEFAIVQIDASPRRAGRLAARLVEAMGQPAELSSGRVFSGCSVGTEIAASGDIEPAEAVRHADLALYRAKQSGRNQYRFFEPEMDAALRFRRAIEDDLRQALADGNLHMLYQPQSDRYGSMIGVEALVRWHHPGRGEISPAFFVPIAEECGLIAELGLFTLRRAFEDSKRWSGLKVAINVSAGQLRLKDFISRLGELVNELQVDPYNFELEITEGLLLGDDPVTHTTLANLRKMGFSIALDDFGTGYSSLSYLQQYPIDKIKIDRSFIKNLGVERGAEAVVEAIVKLARALNLRVIAEGVETEDQLRHLLSIGCGETQGYLLSRPIAANEIDKLNTFAEAA